VRLLGKGSRDGVKIRWFAVTFFQKKDLAKGILAVGYVAEKDLKTQKETLQHVLSSLHSTDD